MENIPAALLRNCSILKNAHKIHKSLTTSNEITDGRLLKGGYDSDVVLLFSFGLVALICTFVLYAYVRSVIFRRKVQKILQQIEGGERTTAKQAKRKSLHGNDGKIPTKISFAFLSYYVDTVKPTSNDKKHKQILHNCCGYLAAEKLTAIMGPSGSGKTTLLNLLSGRARNGTYCGHRMINDQYYDNSDYTNFMSSQGYVEQTDTFLETMTVLDTLLFAGYLRLHSSMTLEMKINRVHIVLDMVGLDKEANTHIGGLTSGIQGLSGGQKRRLSIAIELLRLPNVLILDEPTSGLDATSSLFLIELLHNLSKIDGLTVVTTIHQPRAEIFKLFHQMILMDTGGYITYCGLASSAVTYLSKAPSICLSPNDYNNPGDYIIDAIGLDPEREKNKSSKLKIVSNSVPEIATFWKNSPEYHQLLREVAVQTTNYQPHVPRLKQSWIHVQTWTLFERRYSRMYKSWYPSFTRNAQAVLVSIIIVSTFSYEPMSRLSADKRLSADDKLVITAYGRVYQDVMLMFTVSAYGMAIQYLHLIPEYFTERPLLKLERKCNVISYYSYVYVAFLMETPKAVFTSIIIMGVTTAFHNWDDLSTKAILSLYIILIIGLCAWQSVVCAVCAMSDKSEPVYGLVFLLLSSGLLFSGICVGISDIWPIWHWCYYLSTPALTARSLIVASTTSTLKDEMLESSEVKLMGLSQMTTVLLLTVVICRFLAVGIFYIREYKSHKLKYHENKWISERLEKVREGR